MLRRFFPYYGSKLTLAPRYSPFRCHRVIEPFGGAAGYSCYWEPRRFF